MARVTLRLPESLHDELRRRAEAEGVSMNQYVVYALTRAATVDSVADQRSRFEMLRGRFPKDEAEDALRSMLAARK
jgi:uncharacterized protein (DUF1778 family)